MTARACLVSVVLSSSVAAAAHAGFAGTDLFLPNVGRQAGRYPSDWYTTVWVYNPGEHAITAKLSFLQRNTANLAPSSVDVLVPPGDTLKLDNVVESLFHLQAFGALRVTAPGQLVVSSRIYSRGTTTGEADSAGQDFAGVPASFAIGAGESAQILGAHQTTPAASSDYRFNYGFVETTGHRVTVRVAVLDGAGAELGSEHLEVREWSQRQVAFKDHFPGVSTDNARLRVEVVSGSGRVIAYGSGIANASQDPTTFEMSYRDSLLGIATVHHDQTLTGDGTAGAPLGLADGAVTPEKVSGLQPWAILFAAPGGVLGQDTSQLCWTPDHRLGIGTAAPQEQLQITGNLAMPATTASSGQVKLGGWTFLHGYGFENVFVGPRAGNLTATGGENTAVGGRALKSATSGSYNTALGYSALIGLTTGEANTAVGVAALMSNTDGKRNVAVGAGALALNTTGNGNIAVGDSALELSVEGHDNVAVGTGAMTSATGTTSNVALGGHAMSALASGRRNVAIGSFALADTEHSEGNVAVGYGALRANTVGMNVALGFQALEVSTTGGENVAVGPHALADLTTGGQNIAIGSGAGRNVTVGIDNIHIGAHPQADESGTIRLGGAQNATYIAGVSGQTSAAGVTVLVNGDGKLGTQVSSRRYKHEIAEMGDESDVLLRLRPVSFRYRPESDPTQARQFGLIAEEVAAVDPDLVTLSVDGRPEAVRYHFVGAMLLNEVQRQRRRLDEQAEAIARQEAEIVTLRELLEASRKAGRR